jgi:hypothetical protein
MAPNPLFYQLLLVALVLICLILFIRSLEVHDPRSEDCQAWSSRIRSERVCEEVLLFCDNKIPNS